MTTVIDELVVAIGLDGSKFRAGRTDLEQEMGKTRTSMERFGTSIEGQGQKISEVFGSVRRGVVGLVGAFVGGEAAAFIDNVAKMDLHTMQLAHSIGVGTRELSLWQNMVKSVGGSAEDASQTFAGLNDAFMNMRMGNGMPSPGFAALLSRSGINPMVGGSPQSALSGIISSLQGQPQQDQRFWLQQVPGMNEHMMFLLMEIMKHPDKMKSMAEQLKEIGLASDESGEQALDLAKKTTALGAAFDQLARNTFPAITWLVNKLAETIGADQGNFDKVAHGTPREKMQGLAGGTGNFLYNWFTNPNAQSIGQMWNDKGSGAAGGGGAEAGAGSGWWSADRKSFAMNYLIQNAGLSQLAASALVSRWSGVESMDAGPNSVNSSSGASGIAQWLGSRKNGFAMGDFTSQLAKVVSELKSTEGSAYRTLLGAKTPLDAALGAAQYERAGGYDGKGDNFVMKTIKEMQKSDSSKKGDKTSSINIGTIQVSSSKADPAKVADEIPDAMKRYNTLVGINTGLV